MPFQAREVSEGLTRITEVAERKAQVFYHFFHTAHNTGRRVIFQPMEIKSLKKNKNKIKELMEQWNTVVLVNKKQWNVFLE